MNQKNNVSALIEEIMVKRRSIRKYLPDIIDDKVVEQMVSAAMLAPSPSNKKPVRFIRINSFEKKEVLKKELIASRDRFIKQADKIKSSKRIKNRIKSYYRFSEFMFNAPLIFTIGTVKSYEGFSESLFKEEIISCDHRMGIDLNITSGLAVNNFILKAESLGIGTCILTAPLTFIKNANSLLGINNLDIRCFLVAGYPDEKPSCPPNISLDEFYMQV
jgi:nitroreductase